MTPFTLSIGGKTSAQLLKELKKKHNVSSYAEEMMKSPDFMTLPKKQEIQLIKTTVGEMFGDTKYHTTDEIFKKADELGYDLCPAEVGPHYRLFLKDEPLYQWTFFGMKQTTASDGHPNVFRVGRRDGGTWLDSDDARPDSEWSPDSRFVFRFRGKSDPSASLSSDTSTLKSLDTLPCPHCGKGIKLSA